MSCWSMSIDLLDSGLIYSKQVFESEEIKNFLLLVSKKPYIHKFGTRFWKNIELNQHIVVFIKKAISQIKDQISCCLTHDHVCESILMTTVPGEQGQPIHADNYAPNDLMRWYTVGVCLSDINYSTGTFNYIPGSQRIFRNQSNKSIEDLYFQSQREHNFYRKYFSNSNIKKISLKAGSVFCYDTAVLHQGTPNTSENTERNVFFVTFGPTFNQWHSEVKEDAPSMAAALSSCRTSMSLKELDSFSRYNFKDFA